MDRPRTRRAVLATLGAGAAGLAGCPSLEERSVAPPTPLADPPDGVYVPSHVEGVVTVGQQTVGDRAVALTYGAPHRFWTVSGTSTSLVQAGGDVHLGVRIWDPTTETVLPMGSGLRVAIERDGEQVASRAPWPVISQTHGFHFADNVALDGEGTYSVTVETGALAPAGRGAFADSFGESVSVEFELAYSQSRRDAIEVRRLEGVGESGAADPADVEYPLSITPDHEALPGNVIGQTAFGDATVLATVLDDGGDSYLAVSPRTPDNGYALPLADLSVAVARAGESVFEGSLDRSIGPALGYHYGATVPAIRSGDEVTIRMDGSPQVARRQGYETAFLDRATASLTV